MNALALQRATDAIAIAAPGARGYGYSDTQHPWHHDPAIDLPRATWHGWMAHASSQLGGARVLLLGPGPRPGRVLSLLSWCRQVVVVTPDEAEAAALRTMATAEGLAALLHTIVGAFAAARTLDAVAACLPDADALLLDLQDEATLAEAFAAHQGRVREGGLVGIVDRCQEFGARLPERGADRFVATLRRHVLEPAGTRLLRHGEAICIHGYRQTSATRVRCERLPAAGPVVARTLPAATVAGHELHRHGSLWLAWPSAAGPFHSERLWRNEAPCLWVAPDLALLQSRVVMAKEALPVLAAARARLPHDPHGARAAVQELCTQQQDLRPALHAAVETAPWCRELLLAAGTVELLVGKGALGAALWRRAVAQQLDGELVRALATALLQLLDDAPAAKELFASTQREVKRRRIAELCGAMPRGHVLFDYPEVLVPVRGVLEVGQELGADHAAWLQLGIADRCYVEGDPHRVAMLQATARRDSGGRTRVLAARLAEAPSPRTLWQHADGRWSLLPPVATAAPASAHTEVDVTTLDALVDSGQVSPDAANLLVVSAAGLELGVLRGARRVLPNIDVLVVRVWPAPVFAGAPQPQEVQAWLRELDGENAFALRAFHPDPDGTSGLALFRRLQRRAQP